MGSFQVTPHSKSNKLQEVLLYIGCQHHHYQPSLQGARTCALAFFSLASHFSDFQRFLDRVFRSCVPLENNLYFGDTNLRHLYGITCAIITSYTLLSCHFTLVDLTAALSSDVAPMSSLAQLQVRDTMKQRQCRHNSVRLFENGNSRSEQMSM